MGSSLRSPTLTWWRPCAATSDFHKVTDDYPPSPILGICFMFPQRIQGERDAQHINLSQRRGSVEDRSGRRKPKHTREGGPFPHHPARGQSKSPGPPPCVATADPESQGPAVTSLRASTSGCCSNEREPCQVLLWLAPAGSESTRSDSVS